MKSPYTNGLAHTTWKRKYHIVFAPKFKRKEIYGILQIENKINSFAKDTNNRRFNNNKRNKKIEANLLVWFKS